MVEKNHHRKKILAIGSDSEIAKNLLKTICSHNEHLTTVSRNKNSSFLNKDHFCVDLSDINQVINLSKKIEKVTFDIFLYFPGNFTPKEITNVETEQIIEQFNVNLISAICLTKSVIKNMEFQKSGMLIYIGSSSAYSGFKKTSIYCSSKHGLLGFSRSIADEYREKGIKVACLSPGSVDTKMSVPLHEDQDVSTFIKPWEISKLLQNIIYETPKTMWQEEIILKRCSYQ